MDEFPFDRPELTGSLISLEFGSGGRIQQIWAADPNKPEDSEEFQFVLPPLAFGEEFSEDYWPGTIMIGARANDDDPWILSRNTDATTTDEDDPLVVEFHYEFSLLPEISATGKFHEVPGAVPQVLWDITLTNNGKVALEIGELGFPFALNNMYEGFPPTDQGAADLLHQRLYVHKFIGGAASYLFAQRMNGQPPGLLVVPGEDTTWEFYHHVTASLNTPYRWEGIPVVYAHSKATIEREGWSEWFNGHSSRMLAPGESAKYQIRFLPGDRDRADNVHLALQSCGRPCMKIMPGAVAPVGVGIGVEVAGATPTQFFTDVEADLDTDADEEGGYCFVKPKEPGAVKLSFEDTLGRTSSAHLLFIQPIEELIHRRADWIMEHQVFRGEGLFKSAILPADVAVPSVFTDPEDYSTSFGIAGSLSDALFLAEKNVIYPARDEIEALDRYIQDFLRDDLQNPADGLLASSFGGVHSVGHNYAIPHLYGIAANLYHAMFRVSRSYGETAWSGVEYLKAAGKTIEALFESGFPRGVRWASVPGLRALSTLPFELKEEGEEQAAYSAARVIGERAQELLKRRVPFATEALWGPQGAEEAFYSSRALGYDDAEEWIARCAQAMRSHAPSWWWYGSDKYFHDDRDYGYPALLDCGELCLSPTCSANAFFFEWMDRDYTVLPESSMRLAFGGMLAVWALVRPDGASAMGFCPDAASRQYGMSWLTGEAGLGLWHYLRHAFSAVLPSGHAGVVTFGCHFEVESEAGEDVYVVKPWDGIGRKVVVRQIGLEVEADGVRIEEVRLSARKRKLIVKARNTSDKDHNASLHVRGLWGERFDIDGEEIRSVDGELSMLLAVKAGVLSGVEIRTKE